MTLIKRVTGQGITTSVNMELADLGIARWDPQRQANAVMFGDNFSTAWGKDWQSPSIVMYNNDYDLLGIPTTNGIQMSEILPRRQALDYAHKAGGISTILPCDFIHIYGRWVMAAMVVGMGGLGDERATQFWQSPDLITWTKFGPSLEHFDVNGHPAGHPGNVMLTFDRIGDWVYIYGTGGLKRNLPIWLWRNKASEFPCGHWEPWGMDQVGWAWGAANERTPVLPGKYGELCFRHIQGNSVLSFFDDARYCCSALTVVNPTDHWPTAHRVDYAYGREHAQLYGGYISPDSRLNEPNGMKFLVSQWGTAHNNPYHTVLFNGTLQAKGPLIEQPMLPFVPPIKPVPPKPEVPDVTTPQETYALLLRELAASGSTEIVTPDGRKLTLREAVAEIYEQECSLQTLRGHPLHPRESAPQLDHILSGRYEGLVNQAVICAIADHLNIDVGALFAQVRRSIG